MRVSLGYVTHNALHKFTFAFAFTQICLFFFSVDRRAQPTETIVHPLPLLPHLPLLVPPLLWLAAKALLLAHMLPLRLRHMPPLLLKKSRAASRRSARQTFAAENFALTFRSFSEAQRGVNSGQSSGTLLPFRIGNRIRAVTLVNAASAPGLSKVFMF